jgi:hypothetical protein
MKEHPILFSGPEDSRMKREIKEWLKAVRLFCGIVFLESPNPGESYITISQAWTIARIMHP